jgi:hypothetical protein
MSIVNVYLIRLKNKVDSINDYLAERLSYILSIMITFWIVTALVTIPLFYGAPTTVVGWAQYLCSVVFQGIALPVLGYTARKASDRTDKIINDMAEMIRKIEAIVEDIHSDEEGIKKEVEEIVKYEEEDHGNRKR